MKHILFSIFFVLIPTFAFSQGIEETVRNLSARMDSIGLTEDQKTFMYDMAENVIVQVVDSVQKEGMYMRALDLCDSIEVFWKRYLNRCPSPTFYITKCDLLNRTENWQSLISSCSECIISNRSRMADKELAFIYNLQGSAYKYLSDYNQAIRAYESSLHYHMATEQSENFGNDYFNIAFCYDKIEKHSLASDFYEKGLNAYLQYFGTTRSYLLKEEFRVNDHYKKLVLAVFASDLYNYAVHEQDYGDKISKQQYLLMSAHCGSKAAQSEYDRIYGY